MKVVTAASCRNICYDGLIRDTLSARRLALVHISLESVAAAPSWRSSTRSVCCTGARQLGSRLLHNARQTRMPIIIVRERTGLVHLIPS